MNKTIFISSTYKDLATHRRAIWSLLEDFDVNVRGMEQFGARKESPLQTCISEVEQSDIYVGIIGFRLGSEDRSTAKSFTQLEYEKAYALNKEIRIYLIDEENASVRIESVDRDLRRDKLEAFKRVLRERHTIDTFVSEEDLTEKLGRVLNVLLTPRNDMKDVTIDEFTKSSKAISTFLLVPKGVSGREVRLKVQLQGTLYPASKEICSAFNLNFGDAVGIAVKIIEPPDCTDVGLNELYLTGKQLEDPSEWHKGKELDIYARLQFTESEIRQSSARFRSETVYSVEATHYTFSTDAKSIGGLKSTHYEADGKMILLFSDFNELS